MANRSAELSVIKDWVPYWRNYMPRLGTRKLYTLIQPKLVEHDIKLGRDGFCSGQVKLATVLESFQYKRSDSFGVNPPLY